MRRSQLSCWASLAVLVFALPRLSESRGVTAVEKVIELLTKLDKQVTEEGAKEAAEYDKFACFCKEQADNKQYAIERSTDKIASLGASIDKLGTEIQALDTEIGTLGERITELEGEIDGEEQARKLEYDAYVLADKNITEAIEQVQMAIKAMKESKGKMSAGTKLDLQQVAELAHSSVPSTSQHGKVLASLLDDSAPGDPRGYTYRSNDIIATLQYLERTFKESKKRKDEEEHAAAAASDKKVLAWANEKKFKKKSKMEKEELSAEKTQEKTGLETDKQQEETDKQADIDFRDELAQQCQGKAEEWDQRSQSRSAELTAISEAIGILKSGVSTTYGANKKLVGLAAKKAVVRRLRGGSSKSSTSPVAAKMGSATRRAPVSLLQVGGEDRSQVAGVHAVMKALGESANELKSPSLVVLNAKVAMQVDHFEKVRGLIKDLIAKLEAEATSEQTQKGVCDTEMTAAVANRDSEATNMEGERATIATKEAQVVALKQEISDLSKEIAALHRALKEATDLRQAEKEDNEKTLVDAAAGKQAVTEAINVLEAYYGTSSGTSFTQDGATPLDREGNSVGDLAPETSFSGDYTGKQDASKGIIGLLNVILADFERTETAVGDMESAAAGKFTTFKTETENSVGTKNNDVSTKEGEVETLEGAITDAQNALNTAEGLHATALQELEKLKAMCIEGEESYAERRRKREQEIEALKQALRILDDWQK